MLTVNEAAHLEGCVLGLEKGGTLGAGDQKKLAATARKLFDENRALRKALVTCEPQFDEKKALSEFRRGLKSTEEIRAELNLETVSWTQNGADGSK